jgi:predicted ATPase
MIITKLSLHNWRNFKDAETTLRDTTYVLGPNASGKSNFLDVFRFLRDVSKSDGGGLQRAISQRGGLSKVRCLHARQSPEVIIEVELSSTIDSKYPLWKYRISFTAEVGGRHRPIVKSENVTKFNSNGQEIVILNRPDKKDKKDPELLTQTALEQINSNVEFREISDILSKTTYLHLVPQLLKFADEIGGRRLEDDPFGQGFLERVARASEKTRKARLGKIETALRSVIPKFTDLTFLQDSGTGRPHLEIKYKHHRPNGARQREDQFSDGTLRLIAILWLLQDGDSLLLLEEPELSLNPEIVKQIPRLISGIQKRAKKTRQILISTHSDALLDNPGIDSRSFVLLQPSDDGTTFCPPTPPETSAMEAGLSAADVLLPKIRKNSSPQLELVDL